MENRNIKIKNLKQKGRNVKTQRRKKSKLETGE
jgi:hypothetical protein